MRTQVRRECLRLDQVAAPHAEPAGQPHEHEGCVVRVLVAGRVARADLRVVELEIHAALAQVVDRRALGVAAVGDPLGREMRDEVVAEPPLVDRHEVRVVGDRAGERRRDDRVGRERVPQPRPEDAAEDCVAVHLVHRLHSARLVEHGAGGGEGRRHTCERERREPAAWLTARELLEPDCRSADRERIDLEGEAVVHEVAADLGDVGREEEQREQAEEDELPLRAAPPEHEPEPGEGFEDPHLRRVGGEGAQIGEAHRPAPQVGRLRVVGIGKQVAVVARGPEPVREDAERRRSHPQGERPRAAGEPLASEPRLEQRRARRRCDHERGVGTDQAREQREQARGGSTRGAPRRPRVVEQADPEQAGREEGRLHPGSRHRGEPVGQHERREQRSGREAAPALVPRAEEHVGAAGRDHRQIGDHAEGARGVEGIDAAGESRGRRDHPGEVGVALDALTRVEDEPMSGHQVRGVAIRDEGVVEDDGVPLPRQRAAGDGGGEHREPDRQQPPTGCRGAAAANHRLSR